MVELLIKLGACVEKVRFQITRNLLFFFSNNTSAGNLSIKSSHPRLCHPRMPGRGHGKEEVPRDK